MRILWRGLIGIAFTGAVVVIGLSIGWPPKWTLDALNPIVAALAVLTAVISAWGAQTLVEREEDAKQPFPYLSFDTSSRYNVVQLVLRNLGATTAYDIRVKWDAPLLNVYGKPISFSDRADGVEVPVLLASEAISAFVDTPSNMFKRDNLLYGGTISFARSRGGQPKQHPFYLSFEQYRHTLNYTDESLKTHRELQGLPGELSNIARALEGIREALEEQGEEVAVEDDESESQDGARKMEVAAINAADEPYQTATAYEAGDHGPEG